MKRSRGRAWAIHRGEKMVTQHSIQQECDGNQSGLDDVRWDGVVKATIKKNMYGIPQVAACLLRGSRCTFSASEGPSLF